MTASVLKQDPNTSKIQNNTYDIDTQSANFGGNPLRQATKWHLANNSTKQKISHLIFQSF